ncbi:MAG: beta-Ala-His dipeptidase [Oscillospiraceae bacterium]|nr:beta-Ala-His dipeptidase [Oscillospiraceae bacterium]
MNNPNLQAVYRYFTQIAAVPHGSGNTGRIREWILQTAKALSLEAYADAAGNVIIHKQASEGCENSPAVILQGHMDMVCAKDADCRKDMATEGLDLVWDEEFLSADGTTLGGDDGIAIAYAFAILEDDSIVHPPLTAVFTVDEETGMEGAAGLAPDALEGKYLINIDSEQEGVFTVGCAGGIRVHMAYPVERETMQGTVIKAVLYGLQGGHSGTEIHKKRLNANTAMWSLLQRIGKNFHLIHWNGGVRDNVIPTECTVELMVQDTGAKEMVSALETAFAAMQKNHPEETAMAYRISQDASRQAFVLTAECTENLLSRLAQLPDGVQEMNPLLHMPETSLNLGVSTLDVQTFNVDALVRSGSNQKKRQLAEKLKQMAENAGGKAAFSGEYPAWEYVPNTALEQTAVRVFEQQYHKKPVIETIHAGLECGILLSKAPHLECISIGPDLLDIHTSRERMRLQSCENVWKFLLALLQAFAEGT